MTDARFLPWARQGLATALTTTDPVGDAPLPLRVPLKVTTAVGGSASGTASVQLHLHGPADVVGIDPRQVRRTDPAPGTAVEPGYLPLIEFQRPDFPWLFTPASANSEDRLRPWLCLAVLEASEVTVQRPDDRPAIARLEHAGRTLPNLAQSWAWAVVQVPGSGAPADALRSARPGQALSRLFCPRLLRPRTAYVALVVPTFEQGRLAGLGRLTGEVASTAQTAPAWRTDTGPLELPVFHSWEFSTGEEGDFEALVTKLRRVALDPGRVGRRPLSVRSLPAGLPDLGEVPLAGALEAVSPDQLTGSAASDDLGTPLAPSFTEALRALLNTLLPAPAGTPAPAGLVLPPPLYGHWQAGQPTVPPVGGAAWLRRLNLDPCHRVAAGLGARIVELQQEELMASAWAQAGEVIRANQLLRSAQLARAADRLLHRGLAALDAEALLQITSPVAPRVRHGTRTVAGTVQGGGSRVPPAMTGAAFRCALRPRGPLGRRTGVGAADLLRAVNDGTLTVSGPAVARRAR
ncbi:hypothetical protein DEJ48_38900 [Streptomyces venezuelae]|uniref:Uncharacterized protein n=1 Tax=Streptomyces venezuelae TaxID=54571 RepID=A0A5P2C9H9_STRVZ|nr:hypothetical protein [Streptomyces venezuelae]QES38588.1 hypothetical protein DEJ48_38900 [Streptomyces venezuelae]